MEEIWKARELDIRYVEINHPKIVAQTILEQQREIDKLRFIVTCLETKMKKNNNHEFKDKID